MKVLLKVEAVRELLQEFLETHYSLDGHYPGSSDNIYEHKKKMPDAWKMVDKLVNPE